MPAVSWTRATPVMTVKTMKGARRRHKQQLVELTASRSGIDLFADQMNEPLLLDCVQVMPFADCMARDRAALE